ncbi:MAG: kynureninase [Acidobacteriota bacterium]|nr:kynureninase [Acidobacteriota bacterium]
MNTLPEGLVDALARDRADNLAGFRHRFVVPDHELIYLDGNSLGRLPKTTNAKLHELVDREWGDRLIRSWNEGWFDAPQRVGDKIAELLGAASGEMLVADSTSVNLFKLGLGAMRHQAGRHKIITDDLNFPSDLYIMQGVIKSLDRPCHLEVVHSDDGIHGPLDKLLNAIDEDTALVTLTHTVFKSSYTYDMELITRRAHEKGAMVLWDLSHSVGAVPIHLNACDVDLAVGCTYKYLNGGPGAPAFLYVRKDLQDRLENPISGWMGQKNLFQFTLDYEPEQGIRHFLTGTPSILSLTAIEPGLSLLLEAGMDNIRQKSLNQSAYLIDLWESELEPLGFRLNSPRDPAVRGPHISLGHDEGLRIDRALIEKKNVLPDFRRPDNIRLGIPPLYTSYEDIWRAVQAMKDVVVNRIYEEFSTEAPVVT